MSDTVTIAYYTTSLKNIWKHVLVAVKVNGKSITDFNKGKHDKIIDTRFCVTHILTNSVMNNHNSINYTNINISSPAKPFLLMKSENSELYVGISRRIS